MRTTSRRSDRRPWARALRKTPALALGAALAALTLPVQAGDLAHRSVIGFSPSGSHFAFEEFGIQDGSGFPYSSIYVIDTHGDSWVSGTPVRLVDEDEAGSLDHVRDDAMEAAAPALEAAGISVPGNHVASNPVTELSADAHNVTVNPRHTVQPIGEPVALALDEFALPGKDICKDWGETKGFALTVETGGATRTLHKDDSLPESRGCPLGYRIGDVFTHYPDDGAPALAVLVFYERVGFEGPDGRWLAVAGRLD